jgi:hypothetical protein
MDTLVVLVFARLQNLPLPVNINTTYSLRPSFIVVAVFLTGKGTKSGLRSLEVAFPPHDSSDAGSNPAEVVEVLRTEKFREQVLREGL